MKSEPRSLLFRLIGVVVLCLGIVALFFCRPGPTGLSGAGDKAVEGRGEFEAVNSVPTRIKQRNVRPEPPVKPGGTGLQLKRVELANGGGLAPVFESATTSISGGGASYIQNRRGVRILEFDHDIGTVRESPDERRFILRRGEGWEMYQIDQNRAVRTEHVIPDLGNAQWFWAGNHQLLGVEQIYDEDPDPSMEMAFVMKTRLHVYDIHQKSLADISWPEVELGDQEFIRLDGVAGSGEVALSVVKPEQYFDRNTCVRSLGRYRIPDE